ncbi:MAG: glycosyltransferase family 39 protein [Anaerolineae bacterium]|nr:glycosyltransferase family 39 protein [Anaerolineae bacterium]
MIARLLARTGPDRWWWGCLALLMAAGGLLHLTGYNYGLPFVEGYDEGRLFYNALILRGATGGTSDLPGYPPGIFALHGLVQPLVEAYTGRTAELDAWRSIAALRLLAVLTNVVTGLVLALAVRRLAGGLAALLAVCAWFVLPEVLYNTVIALTEAWQACFIMLALYLALRALDDDSPRLALLSVLAALGAIVFKYVNFPILGFGVGVALWQMRHAPRRWLPALLLQAALIGGAAALLLWGYGAGSLFASGHDEAVTFLTLSRLTDVAGLQQALTGLLVQAALGVPVYAGLLLAGTLSHARPGLRGSQRLLWLFALGAVALHVIIVVNYIVYEEGLYRYLIAILPVNLLLLTVAVARLCQAGLWLWGRRGAPPSRRTAAAVTGAALLVFGGLWLREPLTISLEVVQSRTRPDTRAALATWSLNVLRTEYNVILFDDRDVRVFSRDRGGYQGKWQWQLRENIATRPVADWLADDVRYLMATDLTHDWLTQTPTGRAYAADLLLLKQFPPPGSPLRWRGEPLYFYRLGRMGTPADVLFGDSIRLCGYDLALPDPRPGGTVRFTPCWQAPARPAHNYNVYLHLRPAADLTQVITQSDGIPADNRLTQTWDDPAETLIGTTFALTIPADIAPGDYKLIMGLYDFVTGARLTLPGGGSDVVLAEFTIAGG